MKRQTCSLPATHTSRESNHREQQQPENENGKKTKKEKHVTHQRDLIIQRDVTRKRVIKYRRTFPS